MWYKFDVQKFGWQMLPPILRGRVMQGLLLALLQPLVWLSNQFRLLREVTRGRLSSNGQVISIVEAIRHAYSLHHGDVYITDAEEGDIYLYSTQEEQKTLHIHPSSSQGDHTYLRASDEGRATPDFYVHLPDFLAGEWGDITRLIERVKPAGRQYQIIYYTYG